MTQLIAKTELTATYTAYEIEAPDIAASARPGQLVLFRSGDRLTPAPCAITDLDAAKGTVTIVTRAGASVESDGNSFELTGPLGRPAEEEKSGKIVCVAEGLGVAALLPRLREYKKKGWYTQVIAGYPSRDATYWTDRLNEFSDELYVVTEDGSLGIRGPIRHTIKAVCEQTADIDRVFAVGPIEILKATTDVTRKAEIPTRISLNAVFDGNGVAASDEPDAPSATDANRPLPAFDWSGAADLNGLDQDFTELAEKLGIQIKK
jgi:NAD(P)H-flavin reductase